MTSTSNLQKLGSKAQKGSKPRSLWSTHGTLEQLAERLTKLIKPYGTVSADDRWMPKGFWHTEEARLDQGLQITSEARGP